MKTIHDNIWGGIYVSELALSWLDTEEFQRMHQIRQTGVAYKVFPTAVVSRFAHSLGAYHVTRLLLSHLEAVQPEIFTRLTARDRELIALAALLHDIGHGPFSHAFDTYVQEQSGVTSTWIRHEDRSCDLIALINTRYGLVTRDEVDFLQSLVDPVRHPCATTEGQWYRHLIANPHHGIDTDKLDYILRDNHQFGLSMTVDVHRILRNCRVIDQVLCFSDRIQDELWNLFLIRHRLHATIYRHPRILKFERELVAIFQGLESTLGISAMIRDKDANGFLRMTDAVIMVHADRELWHQFETRTSPLVFSKEFVPYKDHQFPRLVHVWFYTKQDLTHKFHLPFPSPHCPFPIPVTTTIDLKGL